MQRCATLSGAASADLLYIVLYTRYCTSRGVNVASVPSLFIDIECLRAHGFFIPKSSVYTLIRHRNHNYIYNADYAETIFTYRFMVDHQKRLIDEKCAIFIPNIIIVAGHTNTVLVGKCKLHIN